VDLSRFRELLIRQRTQAINALRGPLTDFGQIVPQGAANAAGLVAIVEAPDSVFPVDATSTLKVLVAALAHLEPEIGAIDAEIARRAKENDVARRLMTVPPLGHVNMPCRATGDRPTDRHGPRGVGTATRYIQ
jgi:transposase